MKRKTEIRVETRLRRNNEVVSLVALTNDGELIVAESRDCLLRICKMETGKYVGKPLREHTRWVSSVLISDVGEHTVSDPMIKRCGYGKD